MINENIIERAEKYMKYDVMLPDSLSDFINEYNFTNIFENYNIHWLRIRLGIENYILKNNDESNLTIKKAKDDFFNAFIQNPNKYFNSILLNNKNVEKVFTGDRLKEIKHQKVLYKNRIDSIIERSPQNDNEKHSLMVYFNNNIDITNDIQIRYINQILDNGVLPSDNEELRFLYNFISKWMLSEKGIYNIEPCVYSVDFSSDSSGGFASDGLIFMNRIYKPQKDREYLGNLECMIHVICHETQHIIQSREAKKGKKSIVAFNMVLRQLLGYKYYHNNYRFSKIEEDAERVGFDNAYNFLKTFNKEDLILKLKQIEKMEVDRRTYQYEYSIVEDEYNSELVNEIYEYATSTLLDKAVYDNPHVVLDNPVLLCLYDENGMIRPFENMISNDFSKEDNADIFYNHIVRYIQEGELNNIDMDNLEDNKQAIIINNLYIILSIIADKISKIVNGDLDDLKISFGSFERENEKPIADIFKSELAYYFSISNKLSLYINKHISTLGSNATNAFFNKVDLLIDIINNCRNNSRINISDIEKFLEGYESNLINIKNSHKKSSEYSEMYEKELIENEEFNRIKRNKK